VHRPGLICDRRTRSCRRAREKSCDTVHMQGHHRDRRASRATEEEFGAGELMAGTTLRDLRGLVARGLHGGAAFHQARYFLNPFGVVAPVVRRSRAWCFVFVAHARTACCPSILGKGDPGRGNRLQSASGAIRHLLWRWTDSGMGSPWHGSVLKSYASAGLQAAGPALSAGVRPCRTMVSPVRPRNGPGADRHAQHPAPALGRLTGRAALVIGRSGFPRSFVGAAVCVAGGLAGRWSASEFGRRPTQRPSPSWRVRHIGGRIQLDRSDRQKVRSRKEDRLSSSRKWEDSLETRRRGGQGHGLFHRPQPGDHEHSGLVERQRRKRHAEGSRGGRAIRRRR